MQEPLNDRYLRKVINRSIRKVNRENPDLLPLPPLARKEKQKSPKKEK